MCWYLKSIEWVLILTYLHYVCWSTRSSPSQVPTALLTTVLIVWLDYHPMDGISNLDSLLEVTITPLHILLTMECSTRFILWKLYYSTRLNYEVRSQTQYLSLVLRFYLQSLTDCKISLSQGPGYVWKWLMIMVITSWGLI